MDWSSVRLEVMQRLRRSRIKFEFRQPHASIGGASIEDHVQQAILEYCKDIPIFSAVFNEEEYHLICDQVFSSALRIFNNGRRNYPRQQKILNSIAPTLQNSITTENDPFLIREILILVDGDLVS